MNQPCMPTWNHHVGKAAGGFHRSAFLSFRPEASEKKLWRSLPASPRSVPECAFESTRQTSRVATVATARIVAVGDHVGKLAANTFIRCQNTPGTLSRCNPKKSFTCVLAIKTAIPL